MDKNQATGLILFAAVILVYSLFFASPGPPVQEQVSPENAIKPSPKPAEQALTDQEPDSAVTRQQFGDFSSLTQGKEENVLLENEQLKISLSSKGGEIRGVELKEFKTWDKQPLILLDRDNALIDYQIQTKSGPISLNNLFFQVASREISSGEVPAREVMFTANVGNGSIQRIYTLSSEGFLLDHKITAKGVENLLTDRQVTINLEERLKKLEADIDESRRKSYINYYTIDESYDYLGDGTSTEAEQVSQPLKWVSFKQRFFTAGIIADQQFSTGSLASETPSDTLSVKNMQATLLLPMDGQEGNVTYFFGPNDYKLLKKITPGFDKNVDMGYFFVSWVNKYIIVNLFHFLEKFFSNYGVIIILIVFIIKLFLLPLTYKSYVGMAKMRVIKPEIDELKEKYPDDPAKMQQEQMKLFSKLGVSPISGCLPMLLQMPFLFAMFFFFPNSIELRQESFLWAKDLSTYDSILELPFTIPFYGDHVSLFVILMTLSQIAYTRFNNQMTAVQGPMKSLGYIMPITFMFVLNSFPAALSFYYFVSNMVTFGQQALIKQFVDDDKIRQKIEESKIKNANKKKSAFQLRLEEAMKATEAKKKQNLPKKTRRK